MPSFNPPVRTLLGPGPSDVHPRVLQAMARPTIGHLDPAFSEMMEDLKQMLRGAMRTENAITFPVSAPASAAMEACFVNLVEPGEKVVVCRNGVFGGRMIENVARCGGIPVVVEDPWGRAISADRLAETLDEHKDARIVAMVQAETSTGALSDVSTLCRIAREHDCLTIVDSVTALGGVPLEVDQWQIDACYAGSQKCLSCTPGLAPISFSERALHKVENRASKVQSWFLDLNLVLGYWRGGGKRAYHHTAPINALYGLHEALVMLHEEGLERAWQRHALHHRALAAGLEKLQLALIPPTGERLPQLNAVHLGEGIDDGAVRGQLLQAFNLEIGAGLGDLAGKAWRIGLMGYAARRENVIYCLAALEVVLGRSGAVAAAEACYSH